MNIHANKVDGNNNRAAANDLPGKQRGNNASSRFASPHAQPLQRQILDEYGFSKTLRLAEKHARFDSSLGFTPPTINSSQVARDSDFINAFKGKDELIDVVQTGDEDFSAKVGVVPRNNVGYIMYLPEAGPWIKDDAKKKDILALLGKEDNGQNLTDTIKLEITGRNGHEQLAKEVEAHETVHAKDNMRIRNAILLPWDLKLESLKKNNTVFKGKTAPEAANKLWAAAGGSLAEKAKEVSDAWGNASDAFHDHEHGKTRMDNSKSGVSPNQARAVIAYYLTI